MRNVSMVFATGFLGFIVLFSSELAQGQEAVQTTVSPQDRMAAACQSAESAFASGDANGGCKTLVDALRSLDPDKAELVDVTTRPMHLLIFGMSSLLDDDALVDFLSNTLDPQTNPFDEAVLLLFNVDYRSAPGERRVSEAPLQEQIQRVQRMAQSPHALVKTVGLMALSWCSPGITVSEGNRAAFNSLAALCPEAKSTREVLHQLLLVEAGSNPGRSQALRDFVNRPDWNPTAQALISGDSVVGLVREVADQAAQSTSSGTADNDATTNTSDNGITPVLTAAQNQPEAEVRDWCLRLVHTNAGDDANVAATFSETVRQQCETAAKSGASNTKAVTATGANVQSLESLRARHILFKQAIKGKDLASAGTQMDALMNASSAEEPVDSNTFQNALSDAEEYAMQLILAGEYEKALSAYESIARKYPNSYAAKRDQEHVDHLKGILARQQVTR